MNVRLESMCQGDGKIYAQIAIERLSALSIRSTGSLQRTS